MRFVTARDFGQCRISTAGDNDYIWLYVTNSFCGSFRINPDIDTSFIGPVAHMNSRLCKDFFMWRPSGHYKLSAQTNIFFKQHDVMATLLGHSGCFQTSRPAPNDQHLLFILSGFNNYFSFMAASRIEDAAGS